MNMQATAVMAPPPPKTLDDMQLPHVMMRDIALKTMFRKNINEVSELARAICLPRQVTQELIDMAREQKLVEATGTLNASAGGEMGYQLTDGGKSRTLDALSQSEYFGAMPVPLAVYREQIKRQSIRNIQVTREQLTSAMGHLILPNELLDHLGPAVSAGRSILMYGPPGNGKSSISNGIRDAMGDKVYVPRAIEYAGQVITVYDPIVHAAVDEEEDDPTSLRRRVTFDTRYVKCDRPTVITGGELSLDMLDLVYNPTARTYQAPLQLKSTGGIFIVDDLGRQKEPPQASDQPLDRSARREQRYPRAAIGREIRGAFRYPRDLLNELPPQQDFRPSRAPPYLFQNQDRRPRSGKLPQDFRHGRPRQENGARRGRLGAPAQGQIPHDRQHLRQLSARLSHRPDARHLRL